MSKIQFNELNQNASEFNALSKEEATEVVGGGHYYDYYYYPGSSYSSYSYSYSSDNDVANVNQGNNSYVQQTALGGYHGDTVNLNTTSQGNSANIYQ